MKYNYAWLLFATALLAGCALSGENTKPPKNCIASEEAVAIVTEILLARGYSNSEAAELRSVRFRPSDPAFPDGMYDTVAVADRWQVSFGSAQQGCSVSIGCDGSVQVPYRCAADY